VEGAPISLFAKRFSLKDLLPSKRVSKQQAYLLRSQVMLQRKFMPHVARLAVLLFCFANIFCSPAVKAQTGESIADLKQKVAELAKQTKYTEALPLLEKIVAAEPDNAEMRFLLGFALVAQANATKDATVEKQLRARARKEFIKSKQLGEAHPLVDAMIQSMSEDGSASAEFSKNIEANALMIEAESLFGQGKLDGALKDYQRALELDSTLYHAALFSGDVFVQKGDYAQAMVWYERAITIDPNKETAYRYSGTPLMKQGKTEAARDRYVEAFITEPYNQFSRVGLVQWAQLTKTSLAHPVIDIPTNVTFDEKGDVNINLDASALLGGKDDGSSAWIIYGVTRSTWKKEEFSKRFPNEKVYRHSLPEEAEALRSVIALATADKKVKNLSPALRKLKKLNDEGLLEAYILLARADEGISQDHPGYLKENRDKLRRYMIQYVVTGGGNWQKF
jgi:tetratricopeptide (TPR) repeat protein